MTLQAGLTAAHTCLSKGRTECGKQVVPALAHAGLHSQQTLPARPGRQADPCLAVSVQPADWFGHLEGRVTWLHVSQVAEAPLRRRKPPPNANSQSVSFPLPPALQKPLSRVGSSCAQVFPRYWPLSKRGSGALRGPIGDGMSGRSGTAQIARCQLRAGPRTWEGKAVHKSPFPSSALVCSLCSSCGLIYSLFRELIAFLIRKVAVPVARKCREKKRITHSPAIEK